MEEDSAAIEMEEETRLGDALEVVSEIKLELKVEVEAETDAESTDVVVV